MRRIISTMVFWCWPFLSPAQSLVHPPSDLLKGSELFKTDSAQVQFNVQDQVQDPNHLLETKPTLERQSQLELKAHYQISPQWSTHYQWQLQAQSQFHPDDVAPIYRSNAWKQIQTTDLVWQATESPWKLRTFIQREDDLHPEVNQPGFEWRQGVEGSWQAHRWTQLRTEIRQEQSLLSARLDQQRDILQMNLTQQLGDNPWHLSFTPSFEEVSPRQDNAWVHSQQNTSWENALQWSPQNQTQWSWGAKLRESQSESQSWHEKATGLFTQWQQQLTSRWSWLARYEYEHSQRSALQTGTPLQETERTNFRLRQSWSFTDDLQANFELSHSQENEKVKSQRQDEQRIGVSIRSVF